MVATINGVLGPIETRDLGFTLMHEHILVASWAMRRGFPGYVDREALIRDAIREVGSAKECAPCSTSPPSTWVGTSASSAR